jgi:hypothetical protein
MTSQTVRLSVSHQYRLNHLVDFHKIRVGTYAIEGDLDALILVPCLKPF